MTQVKDEALPEYLQKWIRIRRDDQEFFGLVVGRSNAVVATSVSSVTRPWVLRTQDGDIHFVPEDRWTIQFSSEDGV